MKENTLVRPCFRKIITLAPRLRSQYSDMKKLLLVFTVIITALSLSAQDSAKVARHPNLVLHEKEASESLKNNDKESLRAAEKSDLDKKFAKFAKDRITIDLLAANWAYNPLGSGMNGMRTRWFSRGMNIYFNWDFRITHTRVSIAPGIGYSFNIINSRYQMVEDSLGIHFTQVGDASNVKANNITLQYLDIPVEVRIRTNPDKFDNMWKVAIGIKGGMRVDVYTKQVVKDATSAIVPDVNTTKVIDLHRYPDFNLFRFGPTIRAGYSVFNVTAYYGLVGVFKSGRGPVANEFSFGLSFNGL